MLLQTTEEEDLKNAFPDYQFIDSVAELQPSNGSLIFTPQVPPLNSNELVFQEDFVSSTLDFGLSYMDETVTMSRTIELQPPTMISPPYSVCAICGDRATGRHYGAPSCDGCKGFFRRSVRKNHLYSCRFQRNCIVNKDKRNQCRYCRLRKCFTAGMKKEAVQNERDRISCRRVNQEENNFKNGLTVSCLLNADILTYQSGMESEANNNISTIGSENMNELWISMKQQLLQMVEWAKHIPAFSDLSSNDRTALLRAHAGEYLLMGAAKRSLNLKDTILLGNNCIISQPQADTRSIQFDNENENVSFNSILTFIVRRIIKELILPWKKAEMDDTEFACIKAIVLFDPNVKGLQDITRIGSLRDQIQTYLEDYISDRQYDCRGRLGKLLLTLPALQSISWQMVEQIHCSRISEREKVDSILQDMILGSNNYNDQVQSSGDQFFTSNHLGHDWFSCLIQGHESCLLQFNNGY